MAPSKRAGGKAASSSSKKAKNAGQTDEAALKCINTVRALCADIVQEANSGHPGAPMGCAPITYTLFTKVRIIDLTERNLAVYSMFSSVLHWLLMQDVELFMHALYSRVD
jgi:Transketolase, thiamine diphosphate binding domain